MDSGVVSHSDEKPICENIKSRKQPKKRCTNPATHGKYCGIHYKHPHAWAPATPTLAPIADKPIKVKKFKAKPIVIDKSAKAIKIQKWYRFRNGIKNYFDKGPAVYNRSLCTNETDFFSTDSLADISNCLFFSYKDSDNHVYGFDIRSINQLIQRARVSGETAANPFTRNSISETVVRRVAKQVRWLHARHMQTEWEPLAPPTPEQQIRMKIVDLFHKIDELNYYSSPNWFIDLDQRGQRKFYTELQAIWTHRAGLSMVQKNTIVPNFTQKIFRHAPWALVDQSIESLQKLNMNTIKTLISSATDKNDRILGAMYVVSALTIVSRQARDAYPWLYESVAETYDDMPRLAAPAAAIFNAGEGPGRRYGIANILGMGWLHDLLAAAHDEAHAAPLALEAPPQLQLPPPNHSE